MSTLPPLCRYCLGTSRSLVCQIQLFHFVLPQLCAMHFVVVGDEDRLKFN